MQTATLDEMIRQRARVQLSRDIRQIRESLPHYIGSKSALLYTEGGESVELGTAISWLFGEVEEAMRPEREQRAVEEFLRQYDRLAADLEAMREMSSNG